MKSRFDFAVGYEGGTFSASELLDESQVPKVGDLRTFEIEGKARTVEITEVWSAVSFKGEIRTPVYGRIRDYAAK